MTERFLLAALAAAVAASSLVMAQAPFEVSGAWVREPVPGQSQAAAYALIENRGAGDLQIVAVASAAAGAVEIHEMIRTGDVMKMSPVKSVTVPARGSVELKPGGLHLMLFQLKKPLKEGDSVPLTLTTSAGAKVQISAPVKKGTM